MLQRKVKNLDSEQCYCLTRLIHRAEKIAFWEEVRVEVTVR